MKLLYITNRFPVKSETFIIREIQGIIESDFDITIFSLSKVLPEELANFSNSVKKSMSSVKYPSKFQIFANFLISITELIKLSSKKNNLLKELSKNTNSFLLAGRALHIADFVKKNQIDHVHAHWPYSSRVAALVHELTGVSYSVSIHAHEVAHENAHFPLIFPTLKFAAFCNKSAMDYLMDTLPPQYRQKSHLIYHGVNVEQFSLLTMPYLDTNTPLQIVSAGRLTPTKGFDRLIRACAKARETGINLELTILGSSKSSIADSLRELAKELKFGEYLHLPGWVPFEQVAEYMKKSHIFALLANTDFHDGLPNVVLEAMSSGRPVILSPFPAANEAVRQGIEGFVLKFPEDYEGFVQSLKEMINEQNKLIGMGLNAHRTIVQKFDEKFHLKSLTKLFLS